MLFSSTLVVEASTIGDVFDSWVASGNGRTNNLYITCNPTNSTANLTYITYSFSGSDSGSITSIGGNPSSYSGRISGTLSNQTVIDNTNYYTYHFKVPYAFFVQSTGVSMNDTYGVILVTSQLSCSNGSVSNFSISCGDDIISIPNNNSFPVKYYKGYEITDGNSGNTSYIGYNCYVEFDYTNFSNDTDISDNDVVASTISFNSEMYIGHVRSNISNATIEVNDTVSQQKLDTISQSSEAIQESVTSDTGGGLLATIKNFFGGFFTNIFNTILGLFVPDSTYFSTWFDNLNTLLSDKLGMLYAPFDLLISTLNAVYSADTTEPGITFPGITWDGQTVIEPYTFYFSSLGENFQNLRDAVYFATDVVFLFAFLHLLQKKIALVITGSEVNG